MFPFNKLNKHFNIKQCEYDRLVMTCKLLDELLPFKMEYQIAPYEKEHIVCKIIPDMVNRRYYIYKGCIDIETF